jgi:hypothetical protein
MGVIAVLWVIGHRSISARYRWLRVTLHQLAYLSSFQLALSVRGTRHQPLAN